MKKLENLILDLWNLFDDKKYFKAKRLFHKECKIIIKSSNEIFDNIDSYLQMNFDYPGTWRTILKRVEVFDKGAVSLIHVFSKKEEFYATIFYEFKDELIFKMEEYWSTVEIQPKWREKYSKNIE